MCSTLLPTLRPKPSFISRQGIIKIFNYAVSLVHPRPQYMSNPQHPCPERQHVGYVSDPDSRLDSFFGIKNSQRALNGTPGPQLRLQLSNRRVWWVPMLVVSSATSI